MTENFNSNKYVAENNGEILLTIERVSGNTHHAKNKFTDTTAEIIPLDEYRTQTRCIEHKTAWKDGKFRKSKALIEHNLNWLQWMLEEKGFIRRTKPMKC